MSAKPTHARKREPARRDVSPEAMTETLREIVSLLASRSPAFNRSLADALRRDLVQEPPARPGHLRLVRPIPSPSSGRTAVSTWIGCGPT